MSTRIAIVVGCVAALPALGLEPEYVGSAASLQGPKNRSEIATLMAYGISADGQVVVGQGTGRATAWQPPQYCTESLPPLEEGGFSSALAVNGDGRIIGGRAARNSQEAGVPVRWISIDGQWQIEQLDNRSGVVHGANASGDLAGQVTIPCALNGGCQRAVIWYGAGGSRELGTLGESTAGLVTSMRPGRWSG